MRTIIARFAQSNAGVTAIEYGLIAALVAVAGIVGMTAVGGSLQAQFTTISTSL